MAVKRMDLYPQAPQSSKNFREFPIEESKTPLLSSPVYNRFALRICNYAIDTHANTQSRTGMLSAIIAQKIKIPRTI